MHRALFRPVTTDGRISRRLDVVRGPVGAGVGVGGRGGVLLELADAAVRVLGRADVGGVVAGSDLTWNAQGYLGYRTSVLGQPTTFAIGYRALYVDYDHNEFKWDVTQQGPILGAVLRF